MSTCKLHSESNEFAGVRINVTLDGGAEPDDVITTLFGLAADCPWAHLHLVYPDPSRKKVKGDRWLGRRPTYALALEEPLHYLDRRELYGMGQHVSSGTAHSIWEEYKLLHGIPLEPLP